MSNATAAARRSTTSTRPPLPAVYFDAGGHSFIAFAAGRKYLFAVAMGSPIHIARLPLAHRLDEALLGGKPYQPRRAARLYLKSTLPATTRARRVLRAIARGETEILA